MSNINSSTPLGYHDLEGLVVRNSPPSEEVKKKPNPLSDYNREVLSNRANEIFKKLTYTEGTSNAPMFKGLCDTGVTQFGTWLGSSIGTTYGGAFIDNGIAYVCHTLMNGVNKKVIDVTAVAVQITVTPKALPFLTAFCAGTGGVALPAAVGLVCTLSSWLLASGKFTLDTLPPPDKLLTFNEELNCYVDALGQPLGRQEIEDLQDLVREHDLICKILASDRDDIAETLFNAVEINSRVDTRKKEAKIEKAIRRLEENNRFHGEVLDSIRQLATKYAPTHGPQLMKHHEAINQIESSLNMIHNKLHTADDSGEQRYGFDESNGTLYVPSNTFSRWWYGQTSVETAKKINSIMKVDLLEQCDKMKQSVAELRDISQDELQAIKEKMEKITLDFANLHSLNSSEVVKDALSELFTETKPLLDESLESLREKLS